MVLDNLGSSLRGTLNKLQGKSRLSEEDVDEVVKEIQRSLLSADVDVDLVMELSDAIRGRALDEEPPAGTYLLLVADLFFYEAGNDGTFFTGGAYELSFSSP